MGGSTLLHFLQQMPQSWKDKHLEGAITFGVTWGGSIQAFRVFSVGYDLGVFFFPTKQRYTIQKTLLSFVWLMPIKHS